MYEFLWFLSGAILYKFSAKLLRLYQLFAFFHEMQLQVIAMLIAASEDLEGASSIKYEMLADLDTPSEEVKNLQSIDASIIKSWKNSSIANLRRAAPRSFQSSINFETWEEAVEHYNECVKKDFKL